MGRFKLIFLLVILSFSLVLGGTIKGIVKDADTGEPLIGANVLLRGTSMGASSDLDGIFIIPNVPNGDYQINVLYVGYEKYSTDVTVGNTTGNLSIELKQMVYSGKGITVLADRATRETPVAYSNVEKKTMEVQLGSRDIPMVLNTTPSVYATMQGGGAGDARINIRGFDQRNVAVMINGVPVNDMENGWVYWSNWDGVGDATSSIQVQRGLSAVNLATPSIGGTMNIITDPAAQDAGLMYKQELGNDGFLKSTFSVNSGLINSKLAFNGTIVRKTGDGLIDKTWTDAWAYYFGSSLILNKNNRLEFYALGAPQRHGQNLYKQNIAAYSHEYAKNLSDYDNAALDAFPQSSAGHKYNENWAPVSSSYTGKQFWNGKVHDRYNANFISERENYYHKPQVNLNWYSTLTNKLNLYSTVYYSGGKGGGSGTIGSLKWDYSGPSRVIDYNATIDRNKASTSGSTGILRNSVNTQWTIGALSKAYYKVSDVIKLSAGVDWRTAEINHFREVRDLLGGAYFHRTDSDFWSTAQQDRKLGDKIDYYNTNTVDWIGFYGQGEYKRGAVAAYSMGGYSLIKYTFADHFKKVASTGNEYYVESDRIGGYQIKGGASYALDGNNTVYGNAGYVAKVPIFDNVIDDWTGALAVDPKDEKFVSIEGGLNSRFLNNRLATKLSLYYTSWKDRARSMGVQMPDGSEALLFLSGMDLLHSGIELEAGYQPHRMFRFDLAGSVANWIFTDDVAGTLKDYSSGSQSTISYNYYVKDIKDGDAPQTQLSLSGTVFPTRGILGQLIFRYYAKNYAQWDPFSRTNSSDRGQSWQAPSYGVVDLNIRYDLPVQFSGIKLQLFAHVFNLLDAEYIQDAVDNSSYNAYRVNHAIVNPHMADAAEVFFGLPRMFNVGLSLSR